VVPSNSDLWMGVTSHLLLWLRPVRWRQNQDCIFFADVMLSWNICFGVLFMVHPLCANKFLGHWPNTFYSFLEIGLTIIMIMFSVLSPLIIRSIRLAIIRSEGKHVQKYLEHFFFNRIMW
jgi:hypothetical protein